VPLSTFLCIDLTSNCYKQLLAVNLLKNFLTLQIVKLLALLHTWEHIRSHHPRWNLSVLKSAFLSYHLASHAVKVIIVVIFAIKNTSVTIRFLLHIARGSFEHSLNC